MTIRSRLVMILLPMLIAFVALISLFFYHNWSKEIITSFKSHLQAIAVSTAQTMDPQKISWINDHLSDPDLVESDLYQHYRQKLIRLQQKLSLENLSLVRFAHDADGTHQVYLMDLSQRHLPGERSLGDHKIHAVYYTHEPFVQEESRRMTGYAPIFDSNGNVIALVAAELGLSTIDQKLQRAIMALFGSALFTTLLVCFSVYFIANRISHPVQKLKNAALAIAAGNYSETIVAEGPHEIVELANTLNTMSECLQENITRLQESSFVRERMHGEYECALLLQQKMLEQVVENFHHPLGELRHLKSSATSKPHGLLLQIIPEGEGIRFTLKEARTAGFQGMYELLSASQSSFPTLTLSCTSRQLHYSASEQMPAPLIWSTQTHTFLVDDNALFHLHPYDIVFFFNQGFAKFFENQPQILAWFGKVLRHFGNLDLDLLITMLNNELTFLSKKHHVDHEMHILCFRMRAGGC
jgi:HAMP domain-containing protein